jgi:nanoRNase/pAp phosphatase (c-di-AMP/oligoRNAs hydrolase)
MAPTLSAERIEKFEAVAKQLKGRNIFVLTQFDPDAMSSALAISACIELINPEPKNYIFYSGVIGRVQNKSMVSRLNLEARLRPISEWEPHDDDNLILIDSSSTKDSRLPHQLISNPKIIIDHHISEELTEGKDQFFWIEPIGATATLATELLNSGKLAIDFTKDRYVTIATALTLGIYTDTKGLTLSHERDEDAFNSMYKRSNMDQLYYLLTVRRPTEYNELLRKALNNVEKKGSRAVASLGVVTGDQADYFSSIAEEILDEEGMTFVAVHGLVDGHIKISARAWDSGLNIDTFLKKRFGNGNAGGKMLPRGRGEGGARVSLGILAADSEQALHELESLVKTRIREEMFKI